MSWVVLANCELMRTGGSLDGQKFYWETDEQTGLLELTPCMTKIYCVGPWLTNLVIDNDISSQKLRKTFTEFIWTKHSILLDGYCLVWRNKKLTSSKKRRHSDRLPIWRCDLRGVEPKIFPADVVTLNIWRLRKSCKENWSNLSHYDFEGARRKYNFYCLGVFLLSSSWHKFPILINKFIFSN